MASFVELDTIVVGISRETSSACVGPKRTTKIVNNYNSIVDIVNKQCKEENVNPYILARIGGPEGWWADSKVREESLVNKYKDNWDLKNKISYDIYKDLKKKGLYNKLYKDFRPTLFYAYGPLKVTGITARELGYKGTPKDLENIEESTKLAIKLLKERIFPKTGYNIRLISQTYNTGSIKRKSKPSRWRDDAITKRFLNYRTFKN